MMQQRNARSVLVVALVVAVGCTTRRPELACDKETAAAIRANNAFALDLYAKLAAADEGGNLFFSPLSCMGPLIMATEGARAHTAVEMHRVLHLPDELSDVHKGLDNLRRRYESQKDTLDIAICNAMWGDKNFPYREEYRRRIDSYYETGGFREADFAGAPEAERTRINEWASRRTQGRIEEALPQGVLTSNTRLMLVNAIYLKARWQEPFPVHGTRYRAFTRSDGSRTTIPLMHRSSMECVRYGAFRANGSFFKTPTKVPTGYEGPATDAGPRGFSAVELPYRGGRLAMIIIAPNSPDGLPAIEEKLTGRTLDRWVSRLKKRKTHVLIPRFRSSTWYDLGNTLVAMGMSSAFGEDARFDGMIASGHPHPGLCLGAAVHAALVDVHEEGTEGAAVSALEGMPIGEGGPKVMPFIPTFRADRPFFYCIRDTENGCIIFAGRVVAPASAEIPRSTE